MTIVQVIGYIFKLAGQILDLHAQGKLTRETLDAAVAQLHQVQ